MTTDQPWPWPQELDALLAAPASHHVLLETSQVRVLDVVIEPGAREPEHTHQTPSVMIIDSPARIRYYSGGTLQFESHARAAGAPGPRVRWMEPEGPHSVENIDQHRYHAMPSASSSNSARPGTQPRDRRSARASPASQHRAALKGRAPAGSSSGPTAATALRDTAFSSRGARIPQNADHNGKRPAMVRQLMARAPGQHVGLPTDDAEAFCASLGYRRQPVFMSAIVGEWLLSEANQA
jgi:hypothetical protein